MSRKHFWTCARWWTCTLQTSFFSRVFKCCVPCFDRWRYVVCLAWIKKEKKNTNNNDDVKNDILRRSLIDFARQLLKYWTVILLSRQNSYVCWTSILKCWDTICSGRWQFCTFIALFTISNNSINTLVYKLKFNRIMYYISENLMKITQWQCSAICILLLWVYFNFS